MTLLDLPNKRLAHTRRGKRERAHNGSTKQTLRNGTLASCAPNRETLPGLELAVEGATEVGVDDVAVREVEVAGASAGDTEVDDEDGEEEIGVAGEGEAKGEREAEEEVTEVEE